MRLRPYTLPVFRAIKAVLTHSRKTVGRSLKNDPVSCCGISYIWSTGLDDPFLPACIQHDAMYAEYPHSITRAEADMRFLTMMLEIARNEEFYTRRKERAFLYYRLARTLGWLWW